MSRPLAGKLVRCFAVSVTTTLVTLSLITLLMLAAGVGGVAANVVGTAAGTALSLSLNRRWVWRQEGRAAFARQVVPFWLLSFSGLALSSMAVGAVTWIVHGLGWTSFATAAAADLANVATFGILWIAQFVLLDRWLFRPASNRTYIEASCRVLAHPQDRSYLRVGT